MPSLDLVNKNKNIVLEWSNFIKNKKVQAKSIRKIILQSWIRSKKYGIDPFNKNFNIKLNKEELSNKCNKSINLLNTAKPFMESIYKIVKDANFIIRFADKDGYILTHIGEKDLINKYYNCGFCDGYNVSEKNIGTNAIGIVLITGKPVQVAGGEHYLKWYHNLTSSACAIKDKMGNILGVLSITGNSDLVHPHTLGMVVAAAEAIEKGIKLEEYNNELKTINERFYQITESISEGIIRIDNDCKIVSINRFARKLLSYRESDVIGNEFKNILHSNNSLRVINGVKNKKKFDEEEIYFKTRIGRKKTCNTNITPIKSYNSNSNGAVITFRETKAVHNLVNKIVGANARFTFDDILGESEAIINTIKLASIASKNNSTILLQGESGTGKEMFAQAIHNASDRREYPFVFLNCGAIPRELVSSELFGYMEGAFTGAKSGGHPGKFELADGGTIFLDEIGDMPLDAQVSLLRVLEDKRIVRVGGHDVIPVDVRVIVATNKNLKKEVELGNFREDLFYRINVMPILTPALRNRKEDIKILIDHFLKKFCESTGLVIKKVSESFYKTMYGYNWPGNVRELQNVMQRVINIQEDNFVLTSRSLPDYIKLKDVPKCIEEDDQLLSLNEIESIYIDRTLKSCKGNIAEASKILKIGRATMYRKMDKYNIKYR